MGTTETLIVDEFSLALGDGLAIEGEVRTNGGEGRRPVVILSHGFRGHKDWSFWPDVAERLAREGYYVVGFNYSRIAARRAGWDEYRAAGTATLSRELADLETLVDRLKVGGLPQAERADAGRLGLIGHSRAGGSGILFAAEHDDVTALVVWNGGSPPVRKPEDGEPTPLEAAIEADRQTHAARFELEARLPEAKAEVLFVQGDADRQALLEQNREFRRLAPRHSYLDVRGADHTFNAKDPYEGPTPELLEALEATVSFLGGKLQP
ncbi:hypothetical protein J19TS2_44610 [Cohnella xylanilytica]|uniref:alpha/beta hydrolase family protein n=1 Tax=Cohnella xylanilytica TaxID=557555 RepID=UPI001B1E632C|nr:dienelactone hydrolase family protein [Cohnella xylanilytica]GIO14906.1 hypothetical protein J19TS2_44610 [Cohnella xylanilytica]